MNSTSESLFSAHNLIFEEVLFNSETDVLPPNIFFVTRGRKVLIYPLVKLIVIFYGPFSDELALTLRKAAR